MNCRFFLALGILTVVVQRANANMILNLDAHLVSSATPTGPVGVFFTPGTYTVTPIGVAGGGLFNAWSAWPANFGCDVNGANCTRGFENEFEYQSASLGLHFVSDGVKYATDLLALSHAQSTVFTLTVAESVYFGLNDCPQCLSDNRGGNSLLIAAVVPEPAGVLLLSACFIGLLGSRRLRSKTRP